MPPQPHLPAFAREMGLPRHRATLRLGVGIGYAVAASFALLAVCADALDIVPLTPAISILIALKVVANTLAWVAIRRGRFVLEASGLNLVSDVLAMTGAIWATGGAASPLLPIYGIELTVIALLTNVGVTVFTAALTLVAYACMTIMIRVGTLPAPPISLLPSESLPVGTFGLWLVFVSLVIALPTIFVSVILHRLRDREATLAARNAELVEANRQRSQFMANVTHELRTPIHGISGLADLIGGGVYGPTTEKQSRAALDVKSSALGLLRLIDDLLTLARSDAGRLDVSLAEVDTEELLTQTVASARFLAGTRPLEISLEIESALPQLRTDRAKLGQVMLNLLANAVKFTPDGGRVRLRARAIPDGVQLEVIDDGIGIPADELPHVWDEFRQVDGSPERRYGGTGLGLSIVRRLAHALGGRVDVESREGEGSRFQLLLPLRAPEAPRHIALVDDDDADERAA